MQTTRHTSYKRSENSKQDTSRASAPLRQSRSQRQCQQRCQGSLQQKGCSWRYSSSCFIHVLGHSQTQMEARPGLIKIMVNMRHADSMNTHAHTAGTGGFCYICTALLRLKWGDTAENVLRWSRASNTLLASGTAWIHHTWEHKTTTKTSQAISQPFPS